MIGLHPRTVVGERESGVDHLHADLGIELREAQLSLAVLHQRALLHRLGIAVAKRDLDVEADALIAAPNY